MYLFVSHKLDGTTLDLKDNEEDYAMTSESYIEVGFFTIHTNRKGIFDSVCWKNENFL